MSTVLERSRRAWSNGEFEQTLKQELCELPAGSIPLHLATEQGGMVDDSRIAVSVLDSREHAGSIEARVYVFFDEIVGGCNCHDDPVASKMQCEMRINIDSKTGVTAFSIL